MRDRFRTFDSRISFFAFADIITAVCGVLIFITLLLATDLTRSSEKSTEGADPALERKLAETIREQAQADAQARNLQALLSEAQAAPTAEKLEADISGLRAELAEEKKKYATLMEQSTASQSEAEARDRNMGFTDLKAQIRRTRQEAESLARQEAKAREEMSALEQRVTGARAKLLKLREREGKIWIIPDKTSTTKEPIVVIVGGNSITVKRFDRPGETREFTGANAKKDFRAYLGKAKALDQYFVFYVRPSGIGVFEDIEKSARDGNFDVGSDAVEESEEVNFNAPAPVEEIPIPPISPEPATNGSLAISNPVIAQAAVPPPPRTNAVSQTASAAPPRTPPPPKTKSWWQRFLEWIHLA